MVKSWKFRQHYPDGVISVPLWCEECQADTLHRVEGHKLTHICIPCQERAQAEHDKKLESPAQPAPRQEQIPVTTFLAWETGQVH